MPTNQHISRKSSYLIILAINLVLAIVRIGVFKNEPPAFHVLIFFGTLSFFILAWEFLLLMHNQLEKFIPIRDNLVIRLAIQIVLLALFFTVLSTLLFTHATQYMQRELPEPLEGVIYLLNILISIIYNLILFGTYYFHAWKINLISKVNMEKDQANMRYEALRSHLNPHFLFNALTSLNSLIFENQTLASEFLQQLSKVYR